MRGGGGGLGLSYMNSGRAILRSIQSYRCQANSITINDDEIKCNLLYRNDL